MEKKVQKILSTLILLCLLGRDVLAGASDGLLLELDPSLQVDDPNDSGDDTDILMHRRDEPSLRIDSSLRGEPVVERGNHVPGTFYSDSFFDWPSSRSSLDSTPSFNVTPAQVRDVVGDIFFPAVPIDAGFHSLGLSNDLQPSFKETEEIAHVVIKVSLIERVADDLEKAMEPFTAFPVDLSESEQQMLVRELKIAQGALEAAQAVRDKNKLFFKALTQLPNTAEYKALKNKAEKDLRLERARMEFRFSL